VSATDPAKPPRLRPGDRVAVVSPSWGGPALFPRVYEAGLRVLRADLGLEVVELPSTRADPALLDQQPERRARDINDAFADDAIEALFASIGGDDSVRILPHVDADLARAHPKIVMGYSDTTTLLAWLNTRGLVTFHGPSVMAGLAQTRRQPPEFLRHLKQVLFEPADHLEYRPYPAYSEGYPDWGDPASVGEVNSPRPNSEGWRVLQGAGAVEGRLFGGSLDVLEFLKGTAFWPPPSFWDGRLFFFETSEEKPSPDAVKRMLRNYGMQGVLDRVAGLIVGRPFGYSDAEKRALEAVLLKVVAGEFGRASLPVLANVDFGHTDPQLVLPLGIKARLDCDAGRFRLLEPAVL